MFWAEKVSDTGHSRILDNNHVRLSLQQGGHEPIFTGIGFGLGEDFEKVRGQVFDIAFSLREEEWQGARKLALHVKAIKA